MIRVNIIKNWDSPNLLQQTPGGRGIWEEVEFSLDAKQPCDYVIVLNHPGQDRTVMCPPGHIWAIIQEPPTEHIKIIHRGDPSYARIYTTDDELRGRKYIQSQPALPWHINRSYDFLKTAAVPAKTDTLSWVTSNLMDLKGHQERMAFLTSVRGKLEFDLFGRGFSPIDDKWQAIAPYHYSLAVENYSNPHYWSEKLADCFLAWTMPIYYGCTRITDYFPAEAMVLIDIHHPDEALDRIREAVQTQRWHRNLEALRFAREQVLERYQFFPFVVEKIKQTKRPLLASRARPVFIPAKPRTPPLFGEEAHGTTNTARYWTNQVYQKVVRLPMVFFNLAKQVLRQMQRWL